MCMCKVQMSEPKAQLEVLECTTISQLVVFPTPGHGPKHERMCRANTERDASLESEYTPGMCSIAPGSFNAHKHPFEHSRGQMFETLE